MFFSVVSNDLMRKMVRTFGLDEMARARFQHQIAREEADAGEELEEPASEPENGR